MPPSHQSSCILVACDLRCSSTHDKTFQLDAVCTGSVAAESAFAVDDVSAVHHPQPFLSQCQGPFWPPYEYATQWAVQPDAYTLPTTGYIYDASQPLHTGYIHDETYQFNVETAVNPTLADAPPFLDVSQITQMDYPHYVMQPTMANQ